MHETFPEFGDSPRTPEARGMWDDTGDQPVLMLEFDTDDPEFARGFQSGMIWQLLYGGVEQFTIPVYLTNVEMVMRMAEAAGYSFVAHYEDDGKVDENYDWVMVTFTEKP